MPIEFSIWIDSILGNASIICDHDILQRVWLKGEGGITSIVNYEEAYEQLIGDCDALGYLESYSNHVSLSKVQQTAVREYVEAFRDFDVRHFSDGSIADSAKLLSSPAWGEVEKKAQALMQLFPSFKRY